MIIEDSLLFCTICLMCRSPPILDVTAIKTVPHVPLSHPFVERLIGTLRRELLDQIPFWGAADLERKLLHLGIITITIAFMRH